MSAGSVTLGGNMSVAVGPLGRNAEGSGALNTKGQIAAMYSYSKTKGLFGGVSLEGTIIAERQDANRLAYGGNPTAKSILTGSFDPPEWAYVLIDALDRATGLPGGQTWVKDAPGQMGAMGWSSPYGGRTGGGYAFGEGVGAGGSTPNRKRSSSLFSIGGSSNRGARDDAAANAMFRSTPATPSPNHTGSSRGMGGGVTGASLGSSKALEERAPPARPWEARRASSLIPFSKSMTFANLVKDKDRKMGPSSETYNSSYKSDYAEQEREPEKRRASIVRPYKEKPTPSPFVSELDGSRTGTPRDGTPHSSPPRSLGTRSPVSGSDHSSSDRDRDLLGSDEWVQRSNGVSAYSIGSARKNGGDRDLLGSWDADPHGLTANFSKLNTADYSTGNGSLKSHSNGFGNGHGYGQSFSSSLSPSSTPNRSRGNSRASAMQFDIIAEDDSSVRLHETTSAYATRDWALPSDMVSSREKKIFHERKERPFSSYAAPSGWNWRNGGGNDGVSPDRRGSGSRDRARARSRDEVDLTFDDFSARPFDDYAPKPRTPTKKPNLALKAGLDKADGYARAVALYDFAGTTSGDLSLRKGQVVMVLDGDGDAGEWWKGRSPGGEEGLFPANYVEVLDIPKELRGGISKSMLKRRVLAFDI